MAGGRTELQRRARAEGIALSKCYEFGLIPLMSISSLIESGLLFVDKLPDNAWVMWQEMSIFI